MSVNKTYISGQLKLLPGEQIILNYKGVELSFEGNQLPKELHGNHKGMGYLSNQRILFATSEKSNDQLRSMAMPFYCLRDVELKQPIFGSNYIRGTVSPEQGETVFQNAINFKMYFTSGGAIEFGTMYMRMVRGGGHVAPPELSSVSPAILAQARAQYAGYPYGYQGQPTAPGANAYPPPPPAGYPSNAPAAYYSPSDPNNIYTPAQGIPANPPAYTETEKPKMQ